MSPKVSNLVRDEPPTTPVRATDVAATSRRGMRWPKLVAFTLVTWAAFALLLESAVRLLVPPPIRTYHPWLGTHIRSGAHFRHRSPQDPPEFDQPLVYNRDGFRDVEHRPHKPPGTFRIAVLGDSIVEAREVALEETFCRLLEVQLNQRRPPSAPRYEVVNCGTSGAGPLLAYLILRHMPTTQDADLALLVCFANDPADDLRYDAMVERDAEGRPERVVTPPGRLPIPVGVKELLRRHSRAWTYFGSALSAAGGRLKGQGGAAGAAARDDFFAARDDASAQSQSAWELVAAGIGQCNDLQRRRGGALALIAVPLGHQIRSRPEWEPGRKVHNLARGEGTGFQQHLADIAERSEIPYLDLLSRFEVAADATVFFPFDGHLTPEGHRLTAQTIADWLDQSDLLPASAARSP
jgi:hypothetical protein